MLLRAACWSPNRHESSDKYRYGFQGQEKDDEVKGEGNSINYKFRIHDPRVGRFFAVDPLTKKYPWYTPYSFSGNKVIHKIELEGLEETDTEDKKDFEYASYNLLPADELNFISTDAPSENDWYGLLSLEPYDNAVLDDIKKYIIDKVKKKAKEFGENQLTKDYKTILSIADKFGMDFTEGMLDVFEKNKILKGTASISLFDGLISIASLTLHPEDGLKNLPVVGSLVGAMTSEYEEGLNELDIISKWDSVLFGDFNDVMNQEDLKNVILIFSNENLSQSTDVNTNPDEIEYFSDKMDCYGSDYKFMNVGSQDGSNVYIYKTYEIK